MSCNNRGTPLASLPLHGCKLTHNANVRKRRPSRNVTTNPPDVSRGRMIKRSKRGSGSWRRKSSRGHGTVLQYGTVLTPSMLGTVPELRWNSILSRLFQVGAMSEVAIPHTATNACRRCRFLVKAYSVAAEGASSEHVCVRAAHAAHTRNTGETGMGRYGAFL